MPTTLQMPLFVAPADVILRLQLSADLTGVDDVVTSGIIGAQLHAQRIIHGEFCRKSRDVRYFIDAESFSGIAPNGAYRLEVPSGFIRQDTPVVISAGNPNAGPFEEKFEVDPLLVWIDYQRGYVNLDAQTYANCHVRVQCDTGFEDGTTPLPVEGLADYDAGATYAIGDVVVFNGATYSCLVPPPIGTDPTDAIYWALAYVAVEPIPVEVKEAIIALVPMVFNSNQTTNRSDEAQKQYTTATDHAELLLQPYVRTKGFTFRAA
jgi:hypothetical protein